MCFKRRKAAFSGNIRQVVGDFFGISRFALHLWLNRLKMQPDIKIIRNVTSPYLFWTGYWLIWILMLSNFQPMEKAVWAATVHVGIQAAAAYINILFLIPDFLEKKKYLLYGLLSIVILFILCKIHITLNEPDLRFPGWKREIRFPRAFHFGRIYLFLVVVIIVSTAYKFAADRFKNLQRQSELEKQHLQSELQFLKNQINPHFLFNTLNNIYTLTYLKEDNAAPMIMKLSELLRYMLYECQDERVSLEKEAHFLQNIVEMQKLKSETFGQKISLKVEGVKTNSQIAPLLLLDFIENSFKHSDLDTNPDGFIRIELLADNEDHLHFRCINSKRVKNANLPNTSGIGLTNTQKRLDLLYPGRYELVISDLDKTFEIQLNLPLI